MERASTARTTPGLGLCAGTDRFDAALAGLCEKFGWGPDGVPLGVTGVEGESGLLGLPDNDAPSAVPDGQRSFETSKGRTPVNAWVGLAWPL